MVTDVRMDVEFVVTEHELVGTDPVVAGAAQQLGGHRPHRAGFGFARQCAGVERTLQLVYPQAADIEAERISILSLVGAGLLGLRTGQSIMWPDRAGKQRLLRIVDVVHV